LFVVLEPPLPKMPAAKGVKRAAAAKAQPKKAAKVVDPVEQKSNIVLAGLGKASGLPRYCLDMLRAAGPAALGTPTGMRHTCQITIVDMVGEVLVGIEADLEAPVVSAELVTDGFTAEKASLEAMQSVAESALAEKKEAAAAAKLKVEEDKAAVGHAQEAVDEATAVQRQAEKDFSALRGTKQDFESAMTDSFAPLRDGTVEALGSDSQPISLLLQLCRAIGLDESLIKAFPVAASKSRDSRSAFDGMVLKQVEDEFRQHIATLEKKLEVGIPDADEHEAAVIRVRLGLDAAKEQHVASGSALAVANTEAHKAEEALEDAKRAMQEFIVAQRTAESEREATRSRLDEFRQGPLAVFREMRDGEQSGKCEGQEKAFGEGKANPEEAVVPEALAAKLAA